VDLNTYISLALADDIQELFENLDESSSAACSSLASLRRDLKLTVPSSIGFTLRLGGSQTVTLTSVDHFVRATDIVASLRLRFDCAPLGGGLSDAPRCLPCRRDGGLGISIAAGLEECHGGLGEVAAVADLPFVVGVVEDGSDEADD